MLELLEVSNRAWEKYETGVGEIVEVAMTGRAKRNGVAIVGKTLDVEESGGFVELKLPTSQYESVHREESAPKLWIEDVD